MITKNNYKYNIIFDTSVYIGLSDEWLTLSGEFLLITYQ